MKPKPYMISVQWGFHYHYFIHKGAISETAAKVAGEYIFKDVSKIKAKRKGSKPTVYVWKMIASYSEKE
jgi:hypothetical protein